MISFFKSQQPATIIAFLLFFCFIKIPFFLIGTTIPIAKVDTFWCSIGLIANSSFILNFVLAQICLLIQAIWFNYLFHKADYNENNTMVPALYYTLVSSLIPQFNQFSVYIVIGFILLAIFQTLLTITTKDSARVESFNLGVLGGILVIINAHFLFLLPFLFFMLYSVKPFRINEYLMLLFGLLSPFYFAISISYLLDYNINIYQFIITSVSIFKFEKNILNQIIFIITAFYLLMAFVSLRGIMYSTGFKRRKNINMLIFYFIGITITILFSNNQDETVLSFLFIPISVFLTLFMLRMRNKKWVEIFNAIFVLVIFITNCIRIFK